MKLYLIDDDPQVTDILSLIIRQMDLGQVVGASQSPVQALEDLPFLQPDLVVVDLLMPEMDGVELIDRARKQLPTASFLMISQVSSKDMVASAYEAGAEFFIQKPINSVEVVNVIRNIEHRRTLQQTLQQVSTLLSGTSPTPSPHKQETMGRKVAKLRRILSRIGVLGETGAEDITTVCTWFLQENETLDNTTLKEICARFSDSPKTMEQRIRRAAATGMANLAHMGLDDYYNEDFTEYAGTLYSFEQVRREMDYITGKTAQHGNVKIKRFISALLHACQE